MTLVTTGNEALDQVLGGGLTPGSLVVIAGEPGAGKTVLAQQLAFHNADGDRPVRYYTTLSESHTKLTNHLERFSFFDQSALSENRMSYLSVTDLADEGDGGQGRGLAHVLETIARDTFERSPSVVVLDSAKALAGGDPNATRRAVFDLASRVSHTGAVAILVGEYDAEDLRTAPEFAVADCIIELAVREVVDDERRLLRVRKLRGRGYLPGYHVTRITDAGHQVLPRIETVVGEPTGPHDGGATFGLAKLDRMMAGGLPYGDVTLVAGPSGVGKTLLGLHLVRQGLAEGERCVFISVEETTYALRAKIEAFGWDDVLEAIDDGRFHLRSFLPVDLDIDEVGADLRETLRGDDPPRRIVIDGMAELAAAIDRIGRGRRALWALSHLGAQAGAAVLLTVETDPVGYRRSVVAANSALFDNVVSMQYAEADADVRRAVRIAKMRRRPHDTGVAGFHIGPRGIELEGTYEQARGILGYDVMTVEEA